MKSVEKEHRGICRSKGFYGLCSVVVMVVIWQLSSTYFFSPNILPPPLEVTNTFWDMARTGEIWLHIWISMRRIIIGYFWGTVFGIAIGLLMGRILLLRYALDPIVNVLRSIPPVAIIPLAIVWFGIGENSKHFIIFYSSLIVVVLNTIAGVISTPNIRIRAAQCLGASNFKIFSTVVLPSAWPNILTGMRTALGLSFMGVVVAEMIAAESGIGFLIMQGRLMIMVSMMYVGLITLGIMGAITDQIFQYISSKTMRRYMLEIVK